MFWEQVSSGIHGLRARARLVSARPVQNARAPLSGRVIKALVIKRPAPIVDSRNKLVLVWSAKSGCTFAVKWMFSHMGLLEEAKAYDPWIHKYRVHMLYSSACHKASVEDFSNSPSSYRVVRFVRQPFKRAVSSYIHALRCGYEDAQLTTFLGVGVDKASRFSFREFVRYLGTIDLKNANVHHRLQVHPFERHFTAAAGFLMNIDHSMESLPKLEVYLGLPQTDPQRYRDSRHHTRTSSDSSSQFSADRLFDFTGKTGPVLPDYRTFYDSDIEDRIYNLYAEDFLKYGFSTKLDG